MINMMQVLNKNFNIIMNKSGKGPEKEAIL